MCIPNTAILLLILSNNGASQCSGLTQVQVNTHTKERVSALGGIVKVKWEVRQEASLAPFTSQLSPGYMPGFDQLTGTTIPCPHKEG